jgi:hypothetical protein
VTVDVVSMRRRRPGGPGDLVVDRTSPVGNPFRVGGGLTRDGACDAFEAAYMRALRDPAHPWSRWTARAVEAHRRLGRLALFCWCAPGRCHAETLAEAIELLT